MGTDTADTVAGLQDWIGRTETVEDEASLHVVRRLAALLDRDPAAYRNGAELPRAWHAVFFAPLARQSHLAEDGHPRKGDFLPPVPLPRRMFAGRRMSFRASLPIGAAITRRSTVAAIAHKAGRSGDMVFVRVDHVVSADGMPCITEEHDIVYRAAAAPGAGAPPPAGAEAFPVPDAAEPYAPDATVLFRYSALTFNAHRIHYDLPYATGTEGYPALVVNGGLTALRLAELAKQLLPDGRLERLAVRNARPFFAGRHGRLAAKRQPDGTVALWALDEAGCVVARADAA